MILKGNQRAGGQQLAVHLLNSFDNERVEVAEVRGAVAQDLSGAFAEWAAEARGTKCKKFLYSLSLNPDQSQGRLTREQYLDLLERTERSLKLVGQPRAVVFHEKKDKDGVPREHCHAVWSRIDTEHRKAVQISHDRLKLRTVAREFARDYGLQLPDGLKKDGKRDRFNKRAENLAEKQQQERTGVPKDERMHDLEHAWHNTTTGPAFVQAMEEKGYYLARGDSGRYVAVDLYGEIHSLYRQIEGVKSAQIKERLSGYPLDKQPDVESVQAYAKQKLLERQKAQEAMGAKATEGNLLKEEKGGTQEATGGRQADEGQKETAAGIETRKAALQARQEQRRTELGKQRLDLFARQFSERGALREMQAGENTGIGAARSEKQPKGLIAFLTRITGIGSLLAWAQTKQDQKREATHGHQAETLQRRHGLELKELERTYRALDRLETRENRSAETALLREGYRKLRVRSFALKPEFQKAVEGREAVKAAGSGGNKTAALFNRLAAGMGFSKGDLQRAFERARGKAGTAGGSDAGRYAPVDPEELEKARSLRDQLLKTEPRSAPDRERERDRER
jgi:hypothetical protein